MKYEGMGNGCLLMIVDFGLVQVVYMGGKNQQQQVLRDDDDASSKVLEDLP